MPLNKIRGYPIYNNWFIAITELDTMYKQLTSEERYYIATCLRQGLSKNWSSPDFTDTYKKTDNGPGGVQWKSAENSAESSNMKLYN